MDTRLKIDENTLNYICQKEASKIVGKCMKRFEITDNKDIIKAEVKELLYEFMRDLRDILVINGKESINLINKDELKK